MFSIFNIKRAWVIMQIKIKFMVNAERKNKNQAPFFCFTKVSKAMLRWESGGERCRGKWAFIDGFYSIPRSRFHLSSFGCSISLWNHKDSPVFQALIIHVCPGNSWRELSTLSWEAILLTWCSSIVFICGFEPGLCYLWNSFIAIYEILYKS